MTMKTFYKKSIFYLMEEKMNKIKKVLTLLKTKINKLAENKNMIMVFIIFLILQPVLDIYLLFTDEVINIFKFSPATILRILIISFLFIILIFSEKNKKHLKYFIIFASLSAIYTVAHLYNCLTINGNINPNYRVSVLSEIFYIIRMILPLLVIYISFNYKMNFKNLSLILVPVILIFSCTIIFTHFTKISLKSYSEHDEPITQTAIDWIFHPDEISDLSESLSKGIFRGGNQLGNLLIMLLPIMLYITIKRTNFLNCFTVFVQVFSCILIGTRISSFLWLAIVPCLIILMLFFSKIKKEISIKKSIYLFLIILIVFNGYLLSVSPTLTRETDYSAVVKENQIKNNTMEKLNEFNESIKNSTDSQGQKEDFILNNYTQFDIQSAFLFDIYNYKYDPDFWFNIMNSPYSTYNNSRKLQFLIADRIFELNNKTLDKLVGIGFSTTRNGNLYTERDFYAHYYTLGILGSLLFVLLPVILLLICIAKILLKPKENLTFENTVYVMSLALIFVIALLSAHVLDELIVTIFIGFILGQLLRNIFISNKEED